MMGSITISLDFELGWGAIEDGLWRKRERENVYSRLRDVWPKLVTFLKDRDLPLVWATVGGMVSDRKESLDLSHLPVALQAKIVEFISSSEQHTHDGRDLIEALLHAGHSQCIASHSLSHTRFDFAGLTRQGRITELSESIRILSAYSSNVESFVYPTNAISDIDCLLLGGIKYVRTEPAYSTTTGIAKLDWALNRIGKAPPISARREAAGGLISETGSLYYNWYGKHAELMRKIVNFRARRAIQSAAGQGGAYHFWAHPYNFIDTPGHFEDFMNMLDFACKYRDSGALEFKIMSDH